MSTFMSLFFFSAKVSRFFVWKKQKQAIVQFSPTIDLARCPPDAYFAAFFRV
jgi:hypothetical protein